MARTHQLGVPSASPAGPSAVDITSRPGRCPGSGTGLGTSPLRLLEIVAQGAALGPFWQLRDIVGEARQSAADYRGIAALVTVSVPAGPLAGRFHRGWLRLVALRIWYLLPFPLYQLADDAATYPVYLWVEAGHGAGVAYATTAWCTLVLAFVIGVGQRAAETLKAALLSLPVRRDRSDVMPALLDASVNSAPWQVARRAASPRQDDEAVVLVGLTRVVAFSAVYAVVNTLLYVVAERMPINEWLGFAAMLLLVWMVGGAYKNTREHLSRARGR